MKDRVDFETAKLLKEKGFDEVTDQSYWGYEGGPECMTSHGPYDSPGYGFPAPTLLEASRWLRKTHRIIVIADYNYEYTDTSYYYKIYQVDESGKPKPVEVALDNRTVHMNYTMSYSDYKEYEEAMSEGIKYCLKNLL